MFASGLKDLYSESDLKLIVSPNGTFAMSDPHIDYVHIDVVGPLGLSKSTWNWRHAMVDSLSVQKLSPPSLTR